LRCTHDDSPQGHFATIPHKDTLVSIGVYVCVCSRENDIQSHCHYHPAAVVSDTLQLITLSVFTA